MLVLTRRQSESIIIDDNIKLTIVSVGPGRVKIGITAPPDVRIDREEIHTRIQQEQASDVLSIVSSEVNESRSDQNTLINSAAETGILNKPHDEPHIVTTSTPLTSTAKVSKFRPPNKPR
jgi:carbon storage regulator